MQIAPGAVHLTYCTNIHPAQGWEAVFSNLRRFAPALKARFSPSAPFGVGLRLSAREAAELLARDALATFRRFLEDEGLYVAIINGFPYGPFHGTPVKDQVYAPDWREEARVRYTLELIAILSALLPEGIDGGISTAPLSYKPWFSPAHDAPWKEMTANVVRIAEEMARVKARDGKTLHLDIEPEPDCLIETSDEAIAFFERWLLPSGAPQLAAALGVSANQARDILFEHIRVCFDCCHFAVEYENPVAALDRLRAAGIRVGRVQLSSAIEVPAGRAGAAFERLRAFADPVYLHQVVEEGGRELRHFPDLPPAIADAEHRDRGRWRIHFHVPLFAERYETLESTQPYVRRVIEAVARSGATHHLEIET
ncbi:MAG TPA: metabolite traffic protein EboE, partial [Vicinamibacterales bacterium]|nr:metabolite traffic protein EboE [Vicinamibacterales bacterium]